MILVEKLLEFRGTQILEYLTILSQADIIIFVSEGATTIPKGSTPQVRWKRGASVLQMMI